VSKLFDFAFTDRRYRVKTYLLSSVGALIFALTARLALHWDQTNVLRGMIVVFCSINALFILYYLFSERMPQRQLAPPRLRFALPALAIVAALVLGISADKGIVPQLQASIVNFRLAHVDMTAARAFYPPSSEPAQALLRARFQRIDSIADVAYRYQIAVDPEKVAQTEAGIRTSLRQPALSDSTRQAGLVASAKLVDVAALWSTQNKTRGLAFPIVIGSPVGISDDNVRFKGTRTPITFDGGIYIIRHSTVVFDGLSFSAKGPFAEAPFFDLDSASTVIIRDSTIQNLALPLDGITWVNVQFHTSRIELRGGPFTLVNVSFSRDCDLQWLMFSPVGLNLWERIIKADGQPISFAFEGTAAQSEEPK